MSPIVIVIMIYLFVKKNIQKRTLLFHLITFDLINKKEEKKI